MPFSDLGKRQTCLEVTSDSILDICRSGYLEYTYGIVQIHCNEINASKIQEEKSEVNSLHT